MKLTPTFLALVLLLAPAVCGGQDSDSETEARIVALDIAGAFSNDGYKIRDGHWSGAVKPKEKAQVMLVNLYAGNQYYFSLGTDKEVKMALAVYDETGKKVSGDLYRDGGRTAAGVTATASGPYYVSVRLMEGEAASFCLLYSYK